MVHVERVGPDTVIAASRVLRESFPLPCPDYSPEYLRWQLSFPGRNSSIAVAAFDGQEMVGFAAATPRPIRFQQVASECFIVSFVAVRPHWRGQGVAADLYSELLAVVRQTTAPILTFASPNSPGQRSLHRAYEVAQIPIRKLGRYPVFGSPLSLVTRNASTWGVQESNSAEFIHALETCSENDTISANPNSAVLDHYARDPRPRKLVALTDPGGEPAGAAMIVCSELRTGTGIERVRTIDFLACCNRDIESWKAVIEFARQQWPQNVSNDAVMLTNVRCSDFLTRRNAGVRQVSIGVEGYIGTSNGDSSFVSATGTNLEVI